MSSRQDDLLDTGQSLDQAPQEETFTLDGRQVSAREMREAMNAARDYRNLQPEYTRASQRAARAEERVRELEDFIASPDDYAPTPPQTPEWGRGYTPPTPPAGSGRGQAISQDELAQNVARQVEARLNARLGKLDELEQRIEAQRLEREGIRQFEADLYNLKQGHSEIDDTMTNRIAQLVIDRAKAGEPMVKLDILYDHILMSDEREKARQRQEAKAKRASASETAGAQTVNLPHEVPQTQEDWDKQLREDLRNEEDLI